MRRAPRLVPRSGPHSTRTSLGTPFDSYLARDPIRLVPRSGPHSTRSHTKFGISLMIHGWRLLLARHERAKRTYVQTGRIMFEKSPSTRTSLGTPFDSYLARDPIRLVPRSGPHSTRTSLGTPFDSYLARDPIRLVPRSGPHSTRSHTKFGISLMIHGWRLLLARHERAKRTYVQTGRIMFEKSPSTRTSLGTPFDSLSH